MYLYIGRRKALADHKDEYEMAFDSKTWDPLCGFHWGSATTIPRSVIDVTIKEGELIKIPVKVYFDRAVTVWGDEEKDGE
ncbi:MAG TPA: hypothetical protein ENH40_04030 [Nitrospirae bacterium]|nr:hypothetical protein [Nitrospirota bacterium]